MKQELASDFNHPCSGRGVAASPVERYEADESHREKVMSNHLKLWVLEHKDCDQHEYKAPRKESDSVAIDIVPFLFHVHADVKSSNSLFAEVRVKLFALLNQDPDKNDHNKVHKDKDQTGECKLSPTILTILFSIELLKSH